MPVKHEELMVRRSDNNLKEANAWRKGQGKLKQEIDELLKDDFRHDSIAIKRKLQEIVPEYSLQ